MGAFSQARHHALAAFSQVVSRCAAPKTPAVSLRADRRGVQVTSEWTLDYPPFFAYFERLLAAFAYLVDPEIVRLDNLNYAATSAVYFQRATVVVSELVLVLAAFRSVASS